MRVTNESCKADAERPDIKNNRQASLERDGRSIEGDSSGPGRIYRVTETRPARAACSALSSSDGGLSRSVLAFVASLTADRHAHIAGTDLLVKQVNGRVTDSPGVVVGVGGHAEGAH